MDNEQWITDRNEGTAWSSDKAWSWNIAWSWDKAWSWNTAWRQDTFSICQRQVRLHSQHQHSEFAITILCPYWSSDRILICRKRANFQLSCRQLFLLWEERKYWATSLILLCECSEIAHQDDWYDSRIEDCLKARLRLNCQRIMWPG